MSNQIIKRQPLFSGLTDLHTALDRLLDPSLADWEKSFPALESGGWIPRIDIQEKDNQFLIHADIPGVDPKNIEVILENGVLTIKGHKETKQKEEKSNYVRVERTAGYFCRSISLPDVSDSSKITAKSKNGVLEITVPKNSKATSRKIQVSAE